VYPYKTPHYPPLVHLDFDWEYGKVVALADQFGQKSTRLLRGHDLCYYLLLHFLLVHFILCGS
jgi:hypothetical protein